MPNYFLVYPIILKASQPLFNILLLLITFILLMFLLASIFYIANQKNQDDPFVKTFKNLWGFFSELADKILVVPIIGLAVGNLSCEYPSEQVECYSVGHIFIVILSVSVAMIYLILEFLYVYLFFNFTFKIQDSLSRNPCKPCRSYP